MPACWSNLPLYSIHCSYAMRLRLGESPARAGTFGSRHAQSLASRPGEAAVRTITEEDSPGLKRKTSRAARMADRSLAPYLHAADGRLARAPRPALWLQQQHDGAWPLPGRQKPGRQFETGVPPDLGSDAVEIDLADPLPSRAGASANQQHAIAGMRSAVRPQALRYRVTRALFPSQARASSGIAMRTGSAPSSMPRPPPSYFPSKRMPAASPCDGPDKTSASAAQAERILGPFATPSPAASGGAVRPNRPRRAMSRRHQRYLVYRGHRLIVAGGLRGHQRDLGLAPPFFCSQARVSARSRKLNAFLSGWLPASSPSC
ncbi:Uncharacterised protein [Chromobacterium violaceum]|uniref:Uncharacterized protein n=1 Tax=Chromobacterium violaceum TaxID=536 RepID=A0A3S4JVQ5_CHRVL|nr:Uncharacterised protein [Chromobacterium violaceum]